MMLNPGGSNLTTTPGKGTLPLPACSPETSPGWWRGQRRQHSRISEQQQSGPGAWHKTPWGLWAPLD